MSLLILRLYTDTSMDYVSKFMLSSSRDVSYVYFDIKETKGLVWVKPRMELTVSLRNGINENLEDFLLCFKKNVLDNILISTHYKTRVVGGKCHCVCHLHYLWKKLPHSFFFFFVLFICTIVASLLSRFPNIWGYVHKNRQ